METGKSHGTSGINEALSSIVCYCLDKSNRSKTNGLKGASGCIFTTCNKGQLSGKICQSSCLSMWKIKNQASVSSCDSVVQTQPESLSDKQSHLSAFLCFAQEALGKTTLISWPLNLLMPSFPESSVFPSLLFCTNFQEKERKKDRKRERERGRKEGRKEETSAKQNAKLGHL